MKWPPLSAARAAETSYTVRGSSTRWHRPPWNSISRVFSPLVVRGITAMKGTPISLAKYASLTAVDPLDASMTGPPGRIQPLQSA
jgi:hypothetical protein